MPGDGHCGPGTNQGRELELQLVPLNPLQALSSLLENCLQQDIIELASNNLFFWIIPILINSGAVKL